MRLKEEFEKEYDLDQTYRQCVFRKAREFTDELTHGSVVFDISFFTNVFVIFEEYGDRWITMVLWECHYDLEEYKRLVKEDFNPSVSFVMSNLFSNDDYFSNIER